MRRVGGPTVSDQVGAQGRNRLKVSEAASEEKQLLEFVVLLMLLSCSGQRPCVLPGGACLPPPQTPHPPTQPTHPSNHESINPSIDEIL